MAPFRIEAGVRHLTNRTVSLTAMEFEGLADHSGVSVRDRDCIWQEVLEDLGSRDRIWRIWSTDWFRSPAAQTERLLQFLESPKTLLFRSPSGLEAQPVQPLPHVDPPTPALSPTRADRLAPREQVERPEDLVFDDDDDGI